MPAKDQSGAEWTKQAQALCAVLVEVDCRFPAQNVIIRYFKNVASANGCEIQLHRQRLR